MPRGFEGVRRTSAEIQARREAAGPSALWLRINDGEEAIVRFLEQDDDIYWCNVHDVPVADRKYGKDVPCCNQKNDGTLCPGCERDLPRKFKGFINVIWFDAPVFKKDSENKLVKDDNNKPIIVGHKPQVAVWGSGIRVFDDLDEANANYRGLRSRRFRVRRKGVKLNTTYKISPEDVDSGPQPFTNEEKELEKKKYNLNDFIKPPSYDEFMKQLGESSGSNGSKDESESQQPRNPFMRKRQEA